MANVFTDKIIVRAWGDETHVLGLRYPTPQKLSGFDFISTQRGPLFQYRVQYWKNTGKRVGFGSGVEIYDRVFSGIFFTLGYFRVMLGIQGISGYI